MRVFENSGPVYLDCVLDWCMEHGQADMLLFVVRPTSDCAPRSYCFDSALAMRATEILGDELVEAFKASGWPGTQLVDHYGMVYVGALTRSSRDRLVRVENSLFAWKHSNGLPEDICVFRTGSNLPTLLSVTHESEAWVIAPQPPPTFGPSEANIQEFIWTGRYYCKI